ncbi:MAG: VacJ [Gemmatimonadota bacterium]|nr:VacJ [Gemmatimonadota bacterium]
MTKNPSPSAPSEGRPVWFLNRSVLVVRPLQPFVDWVLSLDDEGSVEAEDVWESVNSFLVPEFEDPGETLGWVHANVEIVFEVMLNDWVMDSAHWPEDRSWSTFEQWFEIEYIDLAWDLVDEPLSSDPPMIEGHEA